VSLVNEVFKALSAACEGNMKVGSGQLYRDMLADRVRKATGQEVLLIAVDQAVDFLAGVGLVKKVVADRIGFIAHLTAEGLDMASRGVLPEGERPAPKSPIGFNA
jgi:hypothetical protein